MTAKDTYHNLKQRNLCTSCRCRPLYMNHVTCRECRFLQKKRRLIRYEIRKREGLCVRCKSKLTNNKTLCNQCLIYHRNYNSKKSAK